MTSPRDLLPWTGRPGRVDVAILTGIILSSWYSLAMLPLQPAWIGPHPELLALLTGNMAAVIALGADARIGEVPLVVAVLVGIPGMMMFDPLFWWAGRRWGRRLAHSLVGRGPKAHKVVDRTERFVGRYGWLAVITAYFLPLPTYLVYAAAAWTGMGLLQFLLLDLIGTLLWDGLMIGLGWSLGRHAADVADRISGYGLWGVLVVVVVMVVVAGWRRRASRQPANAPEAATDPEGAAPPPPSR